ncbi:potential E3 ubiquitin-protein ligase ariadne-2-like [Panonychus citri]|uniref:potential E3 ubiquitin-protein ligase ariadne-2-like n=1 Tax=Panonychus citri TaxID=50023 RepID=UPI0023078ACD|nr:potential E3 ubiquitin-protein ligase ariadne-2-like [Panonychus citri]XP_053214670.1 potential E3 ubiquitin-protein ligase ariadne-2-like [Panonychus citri]XP_053214671.1 potential E3 ubiquitin-protein ligase ariadne-2-like [Panonychus citri]XP_053214672.1 potential E3 ubiquitin-protein ligase ariadne-2-like [Panonychus citri]
MTQSDSDDDMDTFEVDYDEDDTCDYDHYYRMSELENELDYLQGDAKHNDPEYFDYECLPVQKVDKLFKDAIDYLCQSLQINSSEAKVLLYQNKYDVDKIKEKITKGEMNGSKNSPSDQIDSNIYMNGSSNGQIGWTDSSSFMTCVICLRPQLTCTFIGLSCGHRYCRECWTCHIETQVTLGASIGIECMASKCHELIPEEFALANIRKNCLREKYSKFPFTEYVNSHPELRFCPGRNCNIIIRAQENKSKRVICVQCKTSFCYKCGCDYHAPTECSVIKKWLTKCADDSETANYISANTKDCPNCSICIEKNGGCNHMQCVTCKHDFCWMCLGDWKAHGSEYYECSRYKENLSAIKESANVQAREALKKYLFYYERWDNHARSLRLEEQALTDIKDRIQREVMSNKGTWIDWQYLLDAASLLAKCRYTLQYTYPYAYFMETGPRKQLFEYQQAQLEAEIENLSWKLERAETTDRGDLENQMDITEKRRATLLKDFLAD